MNCLLCLEITESYENLIAYNSSLWYELNMQYIIEKHLWKLEVLNIQSYICQACWQEIYNFHKFYLKLEKARSNLNGLLKTEEVTKKAVETVTEEPKLEMLIFKEEYSVDIFEKEYEEESNYPITNIKRKCSRKKIANDNKIIARKGSRKRSNKEQSNTEINELKSVENPDKIDIKLEVEGIEKNAIENRMKFDENIIIKTEPEFKTIENDAKQIKMEEDDQSDISTNDDDTSYDEADSDQLNKLSDEDKFIAENFQITCDICKIPLDTFSAMLKHYKDEHNQRGRVSCCNATFSRRVELMDHIKFHQNPEYLKCKHCDKVFPKRKGLNIHIKEVHEAQGAECKICGKSYKNERGLKIHMKLHKTEDISCEKCGKSYSSKFSLDNHMRVFHLKNIICHLCGKSVIIPDLKRHMAGHEETAPPKVSCKICDRKFSFGSCLFRHMRTQHPPKGAKTEFKCAECPKVFAANYNLKTHIRQVHENAYERKCILCGKRVKGSVALREHMSRHKGEPLYVCGFCPRKFYASGNLHSHRKTCSGKRKEKSVTKRTEDE